MGAVQYWNQGYKVTSEKREDARGVDFCACVQLCIHSFVHTSFGALAERGQAVWRTNHPERRTRSVM